MTQSPELTGGAGFTYGDAVAALYLAALLAEQPAAATRGVVVRVALEQAKLGEPLDDLIVDGRALDGSPSRLSLQIKRKITISAAASNTDFADVIFNSLQTMRKPDFRKNVDAFGVATGTVSEKAKRDFAEVCEVAQKKASAEEFFEHLQTEGMAGSKRRAVPEIVRKILSSRDIVASDEDVFQLLRHFVLIQLDLLHEGSEPMASATARVAERLEEVDKPKANDLMVRLRTLAREGAGRAAVFDRATVLRGLRGNYRLAISASLRAAAEKITVESKAALAQIEVTIDGVEIERKRPLADLADSTEHHLFTQVIGLPGTGKSAALRNFASRFDDRPFLFLKSDRLSGASWTTYATALGIGETDVERLLTEIGAAGVAILFIDGLDRVELPNRQVVKDVILTILNSSALANWRIAATVRDTGVEDLRTWLPAQLFRDGGIATVKIGGLDNDEVKILAAAKPALKPLLYGDERVQEIARRPFFAAVLARSLSAGEKAPKSEIELVDVWWKGGGYDAGDQKSKHRQRALVQLAKAGAATLGRRMAVKDIDVDVLDQLRKDGVVRDVIEGHSVQFVHDIFFEWAFLHLLLDLDNKWLDEIRAAGEPPVLGRTVELLSQAKLVNDWGWNADLAMLEAASLRGQWKRAWLTAPFSAPTFSDRASEYTEAVFRTPGTRLQQLLVWFQAERTQANPMLLERAAADEEERRSVVRAAELVAWPSDVASWARLIGWLIEHLEKVPQTAIPDLIVVFEVWQNMLADIDNDISKRIVEIAAKWLVEIEDEEHPENRHQWDGPWLTLGSTELSSIEPSLRGIVLRSSARCPDVSRTYLKRVACRERLRSDVFKDISAWSPILARTVPTELTDLTLAELKGELPAEGQQEDFPPPSIMTEWHELGITNVAGEYLPAGAGQQPFHSLFEFAPEEAIRLTRELANHASTAWRQLFTLDPSNRATPIPLELEFPWGRQTFWGDERTYARYRGIWGPYALGSAFMAMEKWALKEVKSGANVDDLIRRIVEGHESNTVLGVAISIALEGRTVSATTLPLATAQRLWEFDICRLVQDGTSRMQGDNARVANSTDVRWLASLFVICGGEELSRKAQDAIKAFPADLAYNFEEEQNDPGRATELKRRAEIWSDVGKRELYVAKETTDGKGIQVQVESPSQNDPDVKAIVERHKTMNQQLKLIHWSEEAFKIGSIPPSSSAVDAVKLAQARDKPTLFDEPHSVAEERDYDRSAVAGVAAAVAAFGQEDRSTDFEWARAILARAAATPERFHQGWFAGAKLMYHPCLYAARALPYVVRRNSDDEEAKSLLLKLAGHPSEEISLAGLNGALGCWDNDAKLAWAALNEAMRISTAERKTIPSPYGYDHTTAYKHIVDAVNDALRELSAIVTNLELVPLPEPWVFAAEPGGATSYRRSKGAYWREPDVFLRWDFLPKCLVGIPAETAMADTARRPAFVELCRSLVAWTVEKLRPSWAEGTEDRRRGERRSDLFEWRRQVFEFLGHVVLYMSPEQAHSIVLDPVLKLDNDLKYSLLQPLLSAVARAGILIPEKPHPRAFEILGEILPTIVGSGAWEAARRHGSDIYREIGNMTRIYLFTDLLCSSSARRFANGDWSDIGLIVPLVTRYTEKTGDIISVVSAFLTLAERAREVFPLETFIDVVSSALNKQSGTPAGWRHTVIASRIAALVQEFAERDAPLNLGRSQALLRILDRLVDMGDRRSAALQLSELFKDVRA